MNNRRSIVMMVLTVILSLLFDFEVEGQVEKLQAAYIYNITKFVEWPKEYESEVFTIGVVGNKAAIIPELEILAASKTIFSKPIKVLIFNSQSEIREVNVLFIPSNISIGSVLTMVAGKNILIISEKNGAIQEGSAVNFVAVSNKLQFELKPSNATKYGLKMNSSLEGLAKKVY